MKLARWEFIGVIFIVLLGGFLHYAYELSDNNQFVALVAPINESIWEHLKMAFYGMLIYAAIEYIFIGKENINFIFAKAFSTLLACFLVVLFYYAYLTFTAHSLYLDILIFILAILIAQMFSYAIMKLKIFIKGLNYWGLIAIILAIGVFCGYTYDHPNTKLFIEFAEHNINL